MNVTREESFIGRNIYGGNNSFTGSSDILELSLSFEMSHSLCNSGEDCYGNRRSLKVTNEYSCHDDF